MSDETANAQALLTRLSYEPEGVELSPLPWPAGLAPMPIRYQASPDAPLPKADVLVVTWTSAEWMALADVLTPGHPKAAWAKYGRNWSSFVPHLTGRSPAKEAGCLGEYTFVTIGSKLVCLFHSQLHLATDDATAPIVSLWEQLIPEGRPELVITTGTAGGIGLSTALGDVFVVSNAKFNCTKEFRSQPWAQERFVGSPLTEGEHLLNVEPLIAVNAAKLPKDLTPRAPQVTVGGDVETVDYFGFDDTDDSYGIVKNDALAHSEEMDDASLPLALSNLKLSTPWLSIRNASDPEVPSSIGTLEEQSKWASSIYQRYRYITTIGSAIACWAVIADL